MQAVDLLRDFPVAADAEEWLAVLKRLQPRQYSISSSPKTIPDEVQLTVSVVRFDTETGRLRGGVCSTFLADVAADTGAPCTCRSLRTSARRPTADTPDDHGRPRHRHRAVPRLPAGSARRRAHGRNWLFFGEQHEATDFYYRDELMAMREDGLLTRLDVAFSRDQRQKIYVQDRMLEHGAELWRWLQDGAHFYVCGDASRMAKDVDDTLTTIARGTAESRRTLPSSTRRASSRRSATCATCTEPATAPVRAAPPTAPTSAPGHVGH